MRVLVSGAGFAGLAAAIELADSGHQVTIVERSTSIREGGTPVDIRGDAIEVARGMGILDLLRDSSINLTDRAVLVDSEGRPFAELPASEVGDSVDDFEIERSELSRILLDRLPPGVETVFAESIAALVEHGNEIRVEFVSGCTENYDLIVGADGIHSTTRKLTFGPEEEYVEHLGLYLALVDLPDEVGTDDGTSVYNWPGNMVAAARLGNRTAAFMYFRSPLLDIDFRDRDRQRTEVAGRLRGRYEWLLPGIREAIREDPSFYFDAVAQVHLPYYHRGRVVLVGDAAHCASPLSGRGASLALLSARNLGRGLACHPESVESGLLEYERLQRPQAARAQATAQGGADLIVPATQADLDARNARLLQMGARRS